MIVVIGSPFGRSVEGATVAGGAASRIALAAARAGRSVQLVGRAGDDAIADDVVLDLARGGVGHVALLRDPAFATPLEASLASDDDAEMLPDDDGQTHEPVIVAPPDRPRLEAADVDLGLRYLTDFAVVALAEPASPETVEIVAEAARWGEAHLVLVVNAGESVPDGSPPDAIVFEAPDVDPDGVFATFVGTFAASLADGTDPGEAFRASIASDGWTGSEGE